MSKNDKSRLVQYAEALFWLLIIIATYIVATKFTWTIASSLLQYLAVAALIATVYLYLKNQSLYHETKFKTDQIMEKQRMLHDRQKTIDLIFDNSADGIMILDQDKKIVEFSPGIERIAGYKRAEALGRDAQQLLKFSAEKNHSLLPDMMFVLASAGKNHQYVENSLITKEGKIVDVEASHTLIHDSKTQNTLALAILRDITYEKALIERDKEFITVTSHQLNTPLSIIRGYASLLNIGKAGVLNQKQQKFIKEILASTEKMIELTNSMLSISRIEQEKIKLDFSDVNVADVVSGLITMLASKAEAKKIKLITKPIVENLVIMADQEKLKQALTNLIENGIKYTKKGRVTVSVVDRPEVIDIIVADTGIGIPSADLERIGSRFFRSQNAIDVDNHGTGLGIFIAQTIAEKHHGHLKIESSEGQSTRVTLTLPKKQPIE